MRDYFSDFCIGVCILVAGIAIGAISMAEHWQKESIKRGHAEYYLDSSDTKQWRWK